jgi:hypothetical protein
MAGELDHATFCGYYIGSGDQQLDEKTLGIALASESEILPGMKARADAPETVPGGVRTFTLRERIPAVTLEVSNVGDHVQGILNVMRHLEMIPGSPKNLRQHQIRVARECYLRATRGGLLWVTVRLLDRVSQGQVVASVTDSFGETLRRNQIPHRRSRCSNESSE